MYYVYVLQSKRDGRLYSGLTKNINRRFKEHKTGHVYSTSRFGKLDLIFWEAFTNEIDANRREKYLKTTKGKRALKIMLKNTLAPVV